MKIFVISNEQGAVIGTARVDYSESSSGPKLGRLTASPGQKLHEIELPTQLHQTKDPGELHKALERHLKQGPKS